MKKTTRYMAIFISLLALIFTLTACDKKPMSQEQKIKLFKEEVHKEIGDYSANEFELMSMPEWKESGDLYFYKYSTVYGENHVCLKFSEEYRSGFMLFGVDDQIYTEELPIAFFGTARIGENDEDDRYMIIYGIANDDSIETVEVHYSDYTDTVPIVNTGFFSIRYGFKGDIDGINALNADGEIVYQFPE